MSLAIETTNLTRRFGTVTAVANLNLGVRAGEIFGFLGRNGAGKPTTIRMLCGLLLPSEGTACVAEVEAAAERCNALDDDCDGAVDEDGGLCDGLQVCDRGACIEPCFEGGCAAGSTCDSRGVCVEATCEGVTCADGQRCEASTQLSGTLMDPGQLEILIKGRRSVRRYTGKDLPQSLIDELLSIACYAPTGVNSQSVLFTVVWEATVMAGLREEVMRGLAKLQEAGSLPEGFVGQYMGIAVKG